MQILQSRMSLLQQVARTALLLCGNWVVKMKLFGRGLQLSSKQYKGRTLYSQKPHQIWFLYSSLLRISSLVTLWNYILHSCSHSLDPNDPTLFNYSFVNMFPDMAGSYVLAFGRCLLAIKEQAVWTGLGRDAGQYQWASKGEYSHGVAAVAMYYSKSIGK